MPLLLMYLFHKRGAHLLFRVAVGIFFILLGIIWVMPFSLHRPEDFLHKESEYMIKVTSLVKRKNLKNTFYAQIKYIDNYPVDLKVKVNDFAQKNVEYLDVCLARGKLTRYKFRNSFLYTLWLKNNSYIKKLPSRPLPSFLKKLHYHIISYLHKRLSPQAYAFLCGVFLGRREFMDKETKSVFVEAGVAHLLAISGLHVGLVSLVLFFMLKVFRIHFRKRLLISIAFLFLYTLLAGATPSTVRATLMYSLFGAGFFLKRRVNIYNLLGLAGLVCVFLRPLWIFDIGFQLSFISVLGIISGYRLFNVTSSYDNLCARYIKNIIFSTVFVMVATTPLISFYFGRVQLLGIVSNLILIPLFTFVLTVSFVFLGFFPFPLLSEIIAEVVSSSIFVFIKITSFLASFKFSFISFRMSASGVAFYYLCVVLLVFFLRFTLRLILPASRSQSNEPQTYGTK